MLSTFHILCDPKTRRSGVERLIEDAGAGAPVGQEHAKADRLHDASQYADGNLVQGSLLSRDLGDELRGS